MEIIEKNILRQINLNKNDKIEVRYGGKSLIIRATSNDIFLEGISMDKLTNLVLDNKQMNLKNYFDFKNIEDI